MGELTLSGIDDGLLARLTALAGSNRVSVETQVKTLLAEAVETDRIRMRLAAADRIAAMTPKSVTQTDSATLLREDRDR